MYSTLGLILYIITPVMWDQMLYEQMGICGIHIVPFFPRNSKHFTIFKPHHMPVGYSRVSRPVAFFIEPSTFIQM